MKNASCKKRSKSWRITGPSKRNGGRKTRFREIAPRAQLKFEIGLGSVSKAIASLASRLLVWRRAGNIVVPEPRRLLLQRGREVQGNVIPYPWRLRSSLQTANPFGG